MSAPSLGHVVQAVVSSIDEENRKHATSVGWPALNSVTVEEGIDKLRALFPDTTLLAALDLVDRESGMAFPRRCRQLTSLCSAQVPVIVGEMPL